MTSYAVIKLSDKKRLTKKKWNVDGYCMSLSLRNKKDLIEVNHILIVNTDLCRNTINKQFQIAYRRLFKLVMDTINSSDSEGDVKLALDEVAKMKKILKEKYKEKVSSNVFHSMWRKTDILERQLKEKILLQRQLEEALQQLVMPSLEEEKGRGR